jgi:hypothetical protein
MVRVYICFAKKLNRRWIALFDNSCLWCHAVAHPQRTGPPRTARSARHQTDSEFETGRVETGRAFSGSQGTRRDRAWGWPKSQIPERPSEGKDQDQKRPKRDGIAWAPTGLFFARSTQTNELPISHAPLAQPGSISASGKRGRACDGRDGRGDVPCLHATAQKKREERPIAGLFLGVPFVLRLPSVSAVRGTVRCTNIVAYCVQTSRCTRVLFAPLYV